MPKKDKTLQRHRKKVKKRAKTEKRIKSDKRRQRRQSEKHLLRLQEERQFFEQKSSVKMFSRSAWQLPGNAQHATTTDQVLKQTIGQKTGFNKEAWQLDPTQAQRPLVIQPTNGFDAAAWKPNE